MQSRDPRWSPDGLWWWDGIRWVPAQQGPPAPAPGYLPASPYPAPAPFKLTPSPGLRTFLIVMLVIAVALTGLLAVFGTVGEAADYFDPEQQDAFRRGLVLWLVFVVLFVLAAAALVAVLARARSARWIALAAGIALTVTCLGSVIRIPVIVAAARAPLGKRVAT